MQWLKYNGIIYLIVSCRFDYISTAITKTRLTIILRYSKVKTSRQKIFPLVTVVSAAWESWRLRANNTARYWQFFCAWSLLCTRSINTSKAGQIWRSTWAKLEGEFLSLFISFNNLEQHNWIAKAISLQDSLRFSLQVNQMSISLRL